MKLNIVVDPPFEVHQKVGISYREWTDEQGRRCRQPLGGCDYVRISIECDDRAGLDYIVELLGDRIASTEEIEE